ncbi:MAG: DUF1801 domain-containing protein [Flavobacteriales bacterium]
MVAPEQINLYIAEQPEWQRRMLVRLRQLIHSVDGSIEETWRWNSPHFDHNGALMLGLTAHKGCVSVWFHKGALIKDPKKLFDADAVSEDKGKRTIKIKENDVLNEAAFTDLVKKAIALNAKGTRLTDAKPERKALAVPPELEAVLKKDHHRVGQLAGLLLLAQEGVCRMGGRRQEGGNAQTPHRAGPGDDPGGHAPG